MRIELKIDLDNYDDPVEENNPDSYLAYVNKHRYIGREYVPNDLVNMEDGYANNAYGVKEVRKETYEHFKKMVDDAKKEDIVFYAESAYRDYDYQDELYEEYVNEYGIEDTFKVSRWSQYLLDVKCLSSKIFSSFVIISSTRTPSTPSSIEIAFSSSFLRSSVKSIKIPFISKNTNIIKIPIRL